MRIRTRELRLYNGFVVNFDPHFVTLGVVICMAKVFAFCLILLLELL